MALVATLVVRSVERLSPSFVRIELAGPELVDLGVGPGQGPTLDVRIKLILPAADGRLPQLAGETWWPDFCALPEEVRGHLRTYTIRAVRGRGADTGVVVDFVLHPGAHGPGSSWAGAAQVGDRLIAVLPRRGEEWGGIEWCPGPADRLLVVGDETAVPAVCSILESLPADATGEVFLEVPGAEDALAVAAPPGVSVHWLPRDDAPVGSLALDAVVGHHAALLPADPGGSADDLVWETPTYSASGEQVPDDAASAGSGTYAWVAGESTMVRSVRRHLVAEVGMRREQVSFMGYWREGVAMRG